MGVYTKDFNFNNIYSVYSVQKHLKPISFNFKVTYFICKTSNNILNTLAANQIEEI